ncbi:NAD(P)-binding protein [Corynespora cassiicola Philippines]|uniref:NAD(P)-binding protein n=1 Tax=Corynespora cassiicola Philippines TaxID=1448308 RepID=A0A2T2MZA9_CORCC|nr:NAD(P)-binding protein [Corynespora cassiicola Philippines]
MTKGLVLITGVNDYIAAVTTAYFLRQGYSLRGTVRSLLSADPLTAGPLRPYYEAGTLTIVEVPDITVSGAFDVVVTGVTGILHLASPVSLSFTDPDPVIHAAQNGTESLLNSALRATNSSPRTLKSVVLMSSIATMVTLDPPPYTITEKDWNTFALSVVKSQGKSTPGPVIYAASKTAAERAFWAFRDRHLPSFTMTAVNPVFVIGAPLIAPKSPKEIVVGVGDVARLLRFVVENPMEADGERYIASSAVLEAQAVADVLRKEFPEAKSRIREGTPGKGYRKDYQVDPEKLVVAIGGYTGFAEVIVETARAFRGLV